MTSGVHDTLHDVTAELAFGNGLDLVTRQAIGQSAEDDLARTGSLFETCRRVDRVAGHESLAEAGVPYCFASGYGDALERMRVDPPYGVLKKPYSQQDLAEVLARVEGDR